MRVPATTGSPLAHEARGMVDGGISLGQPARASFAHAEADV